MFVPYVRLAFLEMGRCVAWFIYTYTMGGILVYELGDQQDDGKELGEHILLQFLWQLSWCRGWDAERMCLDCADKDNIPHAIVLCVVQGD